MSIHIENDIDKTTQFCFNFLLQKIFRRNIMTILIGI